MKKSMRLARRVAFLACCVAAFGCDRSDVFSPLLTCDVALESCQEAIYRSVARLLDAESLDMPPVRVISVEEYEAELNEWYEPDEVEEGPGTIASRLMGFIPNDSTTICWPGQSRQMAYNVSPLVVKRISLDV